MRSAICSVILEKNLHTKRINEWSQCAGNVRAKSAIRRERKGDPLERILCMVLQVCILLAVLESIDNTRSDDDILNRLVDLISEVLREKIIRHERVRGGR